MATLKEALEVFESPAVSSRWMEVYRNRWPEFLETLRREAENSVRDDSPRIEAEMIWGS